MGLGVGDPTGGRVSGAGRWTLVAILLLAFGLRMVRLGAGSLWYDETVSAFLASQRLPDLVAHTARDIHPPGYYVLLHGWTLLVGDSDMALAYFSLFFGVALTALAYRMGRRVWEHRVGWLAALLVACSPYNIWYSQEVRMYTLGAVLAAGLLFGMSAIWRGRRWGWALYVLSGVLGLWVLYYFAFLLLAVNLVLLLGWGVLWLRAHWRRWSVGSGSGPDTPGARVSPVRWLAAQAVLLLLYSPWLPIAWRQAVEPPVPPWRSFTGLWDVVVQTWTALSFGQSAEPVAVWPALLLTALLLGWGLVGPGQSPEHRKGSGPLAWAGVPLPFFLVAGVAGPVVLIYLFSFVTPLFHVRYAFTYSLPFYVLLAAGLARVWRGRRTAGWLALAIICGVSAWSLKGYYTDPRYASDDHRAAVTTLADFWRPGDAILVNAGYAYTALEHYWPTAQGGAEGPDGTSMLQRQRLLPGLATPSDGVPVYMAGSVGGDPTLGWGDPQSDFFAVSGAETARALDDLFAHYHRVWQYRIYDTVTDPEGALRAWLGGSDRAEGGPAPTDLFFDRVFGGEANLRVQGYVTGRDPQADTDQRWDQLWSGGGLVLAGSEGPTSSMQAADRPRAQVGEDLFVALVWRANPLPEDELTLFAGLFDAAGRRWAQVDNRVPPARWPAGIALADGSRLIRIPLRLAVPVGIPPGPYRVEVGWYRLVEGRPEWLPVAGGGDRLLLSAVEVTPPARWGELPLPQVAQQAGVTLGKLRLIGWEMPVLEGVPGQQLPIGLVWQSLVDAPEPAQVVIRLARDSGEVVAEAAAAPGEGRWAFEQLEASQAVSDYHEIPLPADVPPGVYNATLSLVAGGAPLPVRRGPFPLDEAVPLATVRVAGRQVNWEPPMPQHPTDLQFGTHARLLGYDLELLEPGVAGGEDVRVRLRLYWQALMPTDGTYKVFAHLTHPQDPADIRSQADQYPRQPTAGWVPGEYVADELLLAVDPGEYALRVGLYRDDATGARLPVFGPRGDALGDHALLDIVEIRP